MAGPHPLPGRAAARRRGGRGARGADQPEEVVALGLVELEGVDEPVQDAVGDAADAAALEAGVVLDADPGEQGDLLAAQPGDAAVRAVHGQAGLLGRDLGAAGGEELPEVVLGGHAPPRYARPTGCGSPCQYPSRQCLSRLGAGLSGGRDARARTGPAPEPAFSRAPHRRPSPPARDPGDHPGQLLPDPAGQLGDLHRAAVIAGGPGSRHRRACPGCRTRTRWCSAACCCSVPGSATCSVGAGCSSPGWSCSSARPS